MNEIDLKDMKIIEWHDANYPNDYKWIAVSELNKIVKQAKKEVFDDVDFWFNDNIYENEQDIIEAYKQLKKKHLGDDEK